MTRRRQWTILGTLAAIYLVGLGVLAGIVSERFRFDAMRTALVRQLTEATQRARAHAMTWEREVHGVTQPSAAPALHDERSAMWASALDAMDVAIARREVGAADRAWRDARTSALRQREWRPLLEVGDGAMRLGAAASDRRGYSAAAREVYLAALIRARAERSIIGVLRAGEAFQGLGDREVVEHSLAIATSLGATPDNELVRRLRAHDGRTVEVVDAPQVEP